MKYIKKKYYLLNCSKIYVINKNAHKFTFPLKIPQFIISFGQFLQFISPKLASLYAAKLFATPLKHKIPKRELAMDAKSIQTTITIPKINKKIVVYNYGNSTKKVLLVHGWSGRGTQLFKIADELLKNGYSTISFDAPGHGKSAGNKTLLPEFVATILELQKLYGPFEFAVAHSLGSMSILKAIVDGLIVKKAVIIGSGDIIQDIIDNFIKNLKLSKNVGLLMKRYFEKKSGTSMESLSSYISAQKVSIPVLIIHDLNDDDVNVTCAYNIHKHLAGSELLITEYLGHRKILGDKKVIDKLITYLKQ